jgi:hypothetical protein
MSKIKEHYWDQITAVNYDSIDDLDYQYNQYLNSLNSEENSLYYNTSKNESIRENEDTNLGSSDQRKEVHG